jgi:hypothetical protein
MRSPGPHGARSRNQVWLRNRVHVDANKVGDELSKTLLWQKPEFRATVVIAPEQPFDFEQEDPIGAFRGVWSAVKITAVLWIAAIAAIIWL